MGRSMKLGLMAAFDFARLMERLARAQIFAGNCLVRHGATAETGAAQGMYAKNRHPHSGGTYSRTLSTVADPPADSPAEFQRIDLPTSMPFPSTRGLDERRAHYVARVSTTPNLTCTECSLWSLTREMAWSCCSTPSTVTPASPSPAPIRRTAMWNTVSRNR